MKSDRPHADRCHEDTGGDVAAAEPNERPGDDESRGGDGVDGLAPPGLKDPLAVGTCGRFDGAALRSGAKDVEAEKASVDIAHLDPGESGLLGKCLEVGGPQHRSDGGR